MEKEPAEDRVAAGVLARAGRVAATDLRCLERGLADVAADAIVGLKRSARVEQARRVEDVLRDALERIVDRGRAHDLEDLGDDVLFEAAAVVRVCGDAREQVLHEHEHQAPHQPHPGDDDPGGTGDERQDAVEQVAGDEDHNRRHDDQQRLDDQPADLAALMVDGVELRLERGVVEPVDPAHGLRREDVTHEPGL